MTNRTLILCVLLFTSFSSSSFAGPAAKKVALNHELDSSHMSDVLNRARGMDVTLMLSNGASIAGKLADVDYTKGTSSLVQIQSMEGKEFFDAIIVKSTIVAVIYRR